MEQEHGGGRPAPGGHAAVEPRSAADARGRRSAARARTGLAWAGLGCGAVSVLGGCVSAGAWQRLEAAEQRLVAARAIPYEAPELRTDRGAAAVSCAEIEAGRPPSMDAAAGPLARARAAVSRGRAEAALPPPTVSLEVWDFPIGDPSRADREGMYMVGVTQELPPGAAREGRARAGAEEADAALGALDERLRAVRGDARHACIEVAEAEASRTALAASVEALDRLESLLAARRSVTGEPLAELGRLALDRARLTGMGEVLEAQAEQARETLAALGVSPNGAALPADDGAQDPPLEALVDAAMQARGELASMRARVRAAHARAAAAEASASLPTWMVRATYAQTPQARAGVGAMVSMSVPWMWGGGRAEQEAQSAEAQAEEDDLTFRVQRVRVELAQALGAVRVARRSHAALHLRARPAAADALATSLSMIASGGADARGSLDAARVLNEVELETVQSLAALAHAQADLEAMTRPTTVEAP